MNQRIMVGRKQLVFVLSSAVAGLMLAVSGFGAISVIFLLGLLYFLLRFAARPLSRVIARLGFGIRWKFEIAIGVIAALSLCTSLISFGAMNFMHSELHEIQELGPSQASEVLQAVNALEDTQHGFLFALTPTLGVFGVILGATLGAAMAWSVLDPVGRMAQAMRRIASGDFSQPVRVASRDELGELAVSINQTAEELAKLQKTTMAAEPGPAPRERTTHVPSPDKG